MPNNENGEDGSGEQRLALGVAYGLIAGAAVGSLLLALTGNPIWLAIAPGIGLTVGLAVASLLGSSDADD